MNTEDINKLIKDVDGLSKKEKKEKKEHIKKIKKIKDKLTRNGIKLLSMREDLNNYRWYCMTCQTKQKIKMPHLIEHRNNNKLYRAMCDECGTELLKKRG